MVLTSRWWAPAAVVFVLADDLLLNSRGWSVPALGLLDEPAHLATAALLLASVGALRRTRPVLITLAASVVIDLDHLPLYAGAPLGADGRPPTHSLFTVAALAAAGLLAKRHRSDLLACAAGVALHLVRDVATGPGVPLLWPTSGRAVSVPYVGYGSIIVVCALVASIRTGHRRCHRSGRADRGPGSAPAGDLWRFVHWRQTIPALAATKPTRKRLRDG